MRFFEQTLGVYFDDLDPFHILHNARYVLLFERTLGAFWMDLGFGAFQETDHPEQFHLVARNEIDYVSPVRGVGKVRVRVWVERIGQTSLTFAFRLLPLDQDIDHARGICRRPRSSTTRCAFTCTRTSICCARSSGC
jgi:acyl-CoA thioester hydrolase